MEILTRLKKTNFVWWASAAFATLLLLVLLIVPKAIHAENERVITIYHDGIEQTVVTDALTIEEVLQRGKIPLAQEDSVEPARDTKLIAQSYNVNVYRARPVTVIDGTQRYQIMSPHTSARQIAEAAGLKVQDEDLFDLTRIDDFLAEDGVGLKLSITRATPVQFTVYGKKSEIFTQAKTVGDLLKQKSVTLAENDGTNVPLSTPITANMTLEVWRNGVQTVTEEKEVAFAIEQIRDADRDIGFKEVKEAGKKGKKLVTYEVELRNGQELKRREVQSVVTQEAKKQVEIIGVKLGFTGPFQDALARLRMCESGGNYANKRNPTYRGAYQFGYGTWANYGGYYDPADAPPSFQDQAAYNLYKRRGWQPWPACSQKLGLQDVYR